MQLAISAVRGSKFLLLGCCSCSMIYSLQIIRNMAQLLCRKLLNLRWRLTNFLLKRQEDCGSKQHYEIFKRLWPVSKIPCHWDGSQSLVQRACADSSHRRDLCKAQHRWREASRKTGWGTMKMLDAIGRYCLVIGAVLQLLEHWCCLCASPTWGTLKVINTHAGTSASEPATDRKGKKIPHLC